MPLTPKQSQTLQDLRNKNYSSIKLNELSSVLNAAFNREEPDEVKKEIIKGGVEWWIKNPKSKVKDPAAINKLLVAKIKKLASSKVKETTTELRNQEKQLFSEVKNQIKSADDMDKEEEEKHDGDDKPTAAPSSALSMTNQAPPPATPAEADIARLQAEALARIAEQGEPTPVESGGLNIGDYIETGSQYYRDNQKTINKVLAALKAKKFEDGSYLTELASIEYPEIKIFQEVIKEVGLGFTDDDKQKYEDMLSTSKKRRDSVSPEDKLRLSLKSMLNPDQIGVLLKKGGEALIEEAGAWWEKLTTGKDRLSVDDREIQAKIDERRKKIDTDRNRKSAIDEWYGDDTDKKVMPDDTNPFKPIAGDGDTIHGGGTAYNPNLPFVPVDDNIIDSYDIFLPPNFKDFADTPEGKTIIDIMAEAGSYGILDSLKKMTGIDKAQAIQEFQNKDPEGFAKYQEAMSKYNAKIGKAGLDRGGAVDYSVSKDYVDNASSFTEDLIKKAIASGKIERASGEKIYDVWNAFNQVKSGDLQISYDEMEQMQKKLIGLLPRDIITENSDAINQYMEDNKNYILPQFEGDSDLGNFDWLQNILDGKTPEGEIDADLIKEKTLKPSKQLPMVEPKLRYRGKWGGTDELFERQIEEIEKRNLVIEVQRLREDLDTTNQLIQAQIATDRRRFDNCFAPPTPEPIHSKTLPNKFKKEHRAIFQPVVLPNPLRPFEKNTRDEADFQQYKEWTPTVPETTSRFELMKNPLVFPSVADMATGGESLYVAPAKDFNYILNQRFTR